MLLCIGIIVVFVAAFPDEIVSQGETALQMYLSSCSEGTAVTVFLRVDVVGRDRAGKTSLTKSLILQEFDPNELSTRGVVIDPKCQIIVKEACDWTTPLTTEHYRDMYEKNVVAIIAGKLDTPEVKDQYFRSKDLERSRRKKRGQKRSHVSEKSTSTKKIAIKTTVRDSPIVDRIGSSLVAVSSSNVTSVVEERETAGTDSVFNFDAKETGEESSVILPKGSRHAKTTEETTTNMEPSAAVQQFVTILQGSKHGRKETTTKAEPSVVLQQFDQQLSQSTFIKDKGKRKQKRKTQASSQPSFKSDHTFSPSKAPKTNMDTRAKLPESVKKRVSNFLRDKEALMKAQKEMMVTVLDYAGQHVFYATHHLCLSKAGFYYVVFDASQPLDGKTPSVFRVSKGEIVRIPLFDNETNFDRLLEWMSSIHIMEPDHSHRIMLFDEVGIASPAMFLVGTHADKLREQPGLLERQDELMRNKLEGTVLAKHIIWASKDRMCFYVDNTLTDPKRGTVDPQVHLLRQMTEEVARRVAQHHKLPLKWLKFEQEVHDVKVLDKTKKTVSVRDLLHIAKKTAGIKTKEELEVLLHYLSNRAVLLYRPKALKSIEEGVVLDVEWFISQLEKVVTIHTDVPPMFKNDVTRAVQKGIMTACLIRYLLSESGSAQRLIISLMNHFDLLCQYAGFEVDANRDFLCLDGPEEDTCFDDIPDTENSDYFIPCLLERTSPLKLQQMDTTLKTMPLLLSSAPLRIPQPLFYSVLTHLCKRFQCLPVLYRNVGYFHISPGHRLEFSLNRYSFQFVILSETQLPPRSTVCACARNYILHTVERLKQRGMAGLPLHIGFQLTNTSLSVSGVPDDDDFVTLHGFPDQRRQLYNNKNQQVDIPWELLMWYPQLEENVGIC